MQRNSNCRNERASKGITSDTEIISKAIESYEKGTIDCAR